MITYARGYRAMVRTNLGNGLYGDSKKGEARGNLRFSIIDRYRAQIIDFEHE
jgi:hypothetical protein